jgi:hypothetical protein
MRTVSSSNSRIARAGDRDRVVLKLRHDLRGQYLHLALMLVAGVEQDVVDAGVDEAPEPFRGLRWRRGKPEAALVAPRVLIAEGSVQLLPGFCPRDHVRALDREPARRLCSTQRRRASALDGLERDVDTVEEAAARVAA